MFLSKKKKNFTSSLKTFWPSKADQKLQKNFKFINKTWKRELTN